MLALPFPFPCHRAKDKPSKFDCPSEAPCSTRLLCKVLTAVTPVLRRARLAETDLSTLPPRSCASEPVADVQDRVCSVLLALEALKKEITNANTANHRVSSHVSACGRFRRLRPAEAQERRLRSALGTGKRRSYGYVLSAVHIHAVCHAEAAALICSCECRTLAMRQFVTSFHYLSCSSGVQPFRWALRHGQSRLWPPTSHAS